VAGDAAGGVGAEVAIAAGACLIASLTTASPNRSALTSQDAAFLT
jgi:hypothetical protein